MWRNMPMQRQNLSNEWQKPHRYSCVKCQWVCLLRWLIVSAGCVCEAYLYIVELLELLCSLIWIDNINISHTKLIWINWKHLIYIKINNYYILNNIYIDNPWAGCTILNSNIYIFYVFHDSSFFLSEMFSFLHYFVVHFLCLVFYIIILKTVSSQLKYNDFGVLNWCMVC